MAFGDRIKGALANLGTGGAGTGWYLGKNLGMEQGQAAGILAAGGPGAIALKWALRDRGVPEAEIAEASRPRRQRPVRLQQRKTDYTPFLLGGGILAILLLQARR